MREEREPSAAVGEWPVGGESGVPRAGVWGASRKLEVTWEVGCGRWVPVNAGSAAGLLRV